MQKIMSKESSPQKRQKLEDPILLFISVAEDPYFYCFSTVYDEDVWTPELIEKLNLSIPSTRENIIPGCHGHHDEFKKDIWTRVKEGDIPELTNIKRVVLGFYYE